MAEDGDGERAAGELTNQVVVDRRERRRRQPGRDFAHNPHAVSLEPEPGDHGCHRQYREEQLGQQTQAEEVLQPAQREHHRDRSEADRERGRVDVPALGHRQPESIQEGVVDPAHRSQAEQVLHLVEHQQRGRAQGETDDDGV
jgi:hypothetical protein